MKKFFTNNIDLINNIATLEDDELYHFSKVLRGQVGEQIEILCGDNNIYTAEVTSITKNFATAKIISASPCLANPKENIVLFQGLPKSDKLEFIVQKITELGVNKIIPFESNFTIAKNSFVKMERLKKIAIEACKQCGRSKPIEIEQTIKLKNIEKYINNFDVVLFLNEKENPNEQIKKHIEKIVKAKNIAIIIGAEGGFSDKEIEELIARKNIVSISLGKRILRTETASISICGFVSLVKEN